MNFKLNAREEISLELRGHIATTSAVELLPKNIKPLSIDNTTPVCLQLAHVDRMNWDVMPFIRMRFDKAFWHIAAEYEGVPGWYMAVLEISHPLLRHISGSLFHSSVRDACFTFMEKRKSLVTQHHPDTGGEMRCHVELGADKFPDSLISPFYISRKNEICTIHVDEKEPDFCRISKADIIKDEISHEIFGLPVSWDEDCYVFRGRTFKWKTK